MFEKNKKAKNTKYVIGGFVALAAIIVMFVLFKFPQPGVANQGDFYRVMGPAGIAYTDAYINNPNLQKFFYYTITDYKMVFSGNVIVSTILGSSVGYLIALIKIICKAFNQDIFKTQYLAFVYAVIYIFAFAVILKNLRIKNIIKLSILSLLVLFVFFDGNYLVWFNSFYGEPMMIVTLMLISAAVLYYINVRYDDENNKKLFKAIAFVIIACFLFMGSKLQVTTALPFILMFVLKILIDNRKKISKKRFIILIIMFIVMAVYPINISRDSKGLNRDTQFNSVFYGILNTSDTPKQDLIDLGLNPDMSGEAGKHAYLPDDKYEKYIPRTELMEKEFYSKISNFKLAKFYLTHPKRLFQAMEYTASKAYMTSTSLGKYTEQYSKTPVEKLNRFVYWSEFRENKLPRNLLFISFVFIAVFLVSLYSYKAGDKVIKNRVMLLWLIMMIAVMQFPMPFVGNGKADVVKQLYLFNFIFDILMFVSVLWVIFKLIDVIKNIKR